MEGADAVRVCLIPCFSISIRGQPVLLPVGAQKLIGLVALQNRPAPRQSLASTLWPDLSAERAAATLRSALWQIRRRAPGTVAADSQQVRLARGVEVDLTVAFEAMRLLRSADTPPEDTGVFKHDLLTGWYDDWVTVERERYRQARLHALELICHRLVSTGRAVDAIDIGLRAVAADPLRETAQRVLIAAHIADGNMSEAVRQYRTYAVQLRDQLGVDPTPDLAALLPSSLR